MLAYKLQHKRFRFRINDVEPHPDDSDSPPEDGDYDPDWEELPEVHSMLHRAGCRPPLARLFVILDAVNVITIFGGNLVAGVCSVMP